MMHGMKKSDEAIVCARQAFKSLRSPGLEPPRRNRGGSPTP